MAHVRAYRPGDEVELAPRLRFHDLQEIEAASGRSPLDVLREGGEQSSPSCSIISQQGFVVGMFGVGPGGCVWLLGTDELTRDPLRRQFLRECRTYLRALHQTFPLLHNVIDERNAVHIRWLKWLGFTFIRRFPHGPKGLPFLEFARLKDV